MLGPISSWSQSFVLVRHCPFAEPGRSASEGPFCRTAAQKIGIKGQASLAKVALVVLVPEKVGGQPPVNMGISLPPSPFARSVADGG